ncbi:MAG: RNA-guided pseudouridylation complex pseudouridine synthase subunit Cbf5 [Candidatus Thalassarchaeaceae archaeon]
MTPKISIGEEPTFSERNGQSPHERSLRQLMQSGIILVDKPPGPSSHQLAAWAREVLNLTRLGHGGTLDPFATGALTLLLGKATRLTEFILSSDKTYIAVLKTDPRHTRSDIEDVLRGLEGEIYNVPPVESAVKVRVRTRTIHEIQLLESDEEAGIHCIRISCQAGTYIRTIARDIGLLMGSECKLMELHRSKTGVFTQSTLCSMQQLTDAALLAEQGEEAALTKLIAPVEAFLHKMPGAWARDSAIGSICHGAPLAVPGIYSIHGNLKSGDKVVIWSGKGEAVAIGELSIDSNRIAQMSTGEVIRPKVVLMEKDVYPSSWSNRK